MGAQQAGMLGVVVQFVKGTHRPPVFAHQLGCGNTLWEGGRHDIFRKGFYLNHFHLRSE
jgi:hypothetical protein